MNYFELMIAAVVGSFFGAALYHQVQRWMPIIEGFVRRSAKWCCEKLKVDCFSKDSKEESKPLE